jgi:hypothetical protein
MRTLIFAQCKYGQTQGFAHCLDCGSYERCKGLHKAMYGLPKMCPAVIGPGYDCKSRCRWYDTCDQISIKGSKPMATITVTLGISPKPLPSDVTLDYIKQRCAKQLPCMNVHPVIGDHITFELRPGDNVYTVDVQVKKRTLSSIDTCYEVEVTQITQEVTGNTVVWP